MYGNGFNIGVPNLQQPNMPSVNPVVQQLQALMRNAMMNQGYNQQPGAGVQNNGQATGQPYSPPLNYSPYFDPNAKLTVNNSAQQRTDMANPANNFAQLKALAEQTWPNDPIRQQLSLSQAILESGPPGNTSGLARNSNNLFGIKSASGTSMPTTEYVNGVPQTQNASFATNDSPAASFMQHRDLLMKAKRYQGALNAGNIQDAISAMGSSGYATDPAYSSKLQSVWQKYVKDSYGS